MNKVLKRLNLKGYETKVFPSRLCTTPSPRAEEDGVLESSKYFVCVVVDKRFDDQLRVILLRPYIWTDPDNPKNKGVGWVDKSSNLTDHRNRDNTANDHVVAWRPA